MLKRHRIFIYAYCVGILFTRETYNGGGMLEYNAKYRSISGGNTSVEGILIDPIALAIIVNSNSFVRTDVGVFGRGPKLVLGRFYLPLSTLSPSPSRPSDMRTVSCNFLFLSASQNAIYLRQSWRNSLPSFPSRRPTPTPPTQQTSIMWRPHYKARVVPVTLTSALSYHEKNTNNRKWSIRVQGPATTLSLQDPDGSRSGTVGAMGQIYVYNWYKRIIRIKIYRTIKPLSNLSEVIIVKIYGDNLIK